MKAAALVLAAACLEAPPAEGDERAFVEMTVSRRTVYVQEPIVVTIRFGIDAAYFGEHAIQLFRRDLDAPVQILARWLDDLPGAIALPSPPPGLGRVTFALNDGQAQAARAEDRGGFSVFEIERRFLPERPGELALPAPVLRYAYATRFEESVVSGRVPVDRHDALVPGESLVVSVLEVPEAGRPPDWTGAVGLFTVEADASPRALEAGELLKLTLRVSGEGNLEHFDAPRLDSLPGFHVFGRIEEKSRALRTIVYDASPLDASVTRVPAIPFSFFDTGPPAAFRTARTEPIPIEVRAAGSASPAHSVASRAVPGANDIFDLKIVSSLPPADEPRPLSAALVAGALAAPVLLAAGLFLLVRRRERDLADPLGVRARGAAAAFRAEARGKNLADAFAEYLSARLRCPPAAVIGPGLAERLETAGVPDELRRRIAGAVERLVSARYRGSGRAAAADETEARALVGELEALFLEGGSGR